MTTTGYGFQIEMTDRARQAAAQIVETPIVFRDRTAGTSKMSGAIACEALLMVTRRALQRHLRRTDNRVPKRPNTTASMSPAPSIGASTPDDVSTQPSDERALAATGS